MVYVVTSITLLGHQLCSFKIFLTKNSNWEGMLEMDINNSAKIALLTPKLIIVDQIIDKSDKN